MLAPGDDALRGTPSFRFASGELVDAQALLTLPMLSIGMPTSRRHPDACCCLALWPRGDRREDAGDLRPITAQTLYVRNTYDTEGNVTEVARQGVPNPTSRENKHRFV